MSGAIALSYAQDNLGVKKVSAPSKMPHYLPAKKTNLLDFQNQWYINSYLLAVRSENFHHQQLVFLQCHRVESMISFLRHEKVGRREGGGPVHEAHCKIGPPL